MDCKFVVDQKVVHIGTGRWIVVQQGLPPMPSRLPERGNIYTVAAIEACDQGVFLGLKEFPAGYTFDFRSFRPLQDRPKEADTDISVFTPALNVKKLEPVE